MLAAEYTVGSSYGLWGMIFANTFASMLLWVDDINQLRYELPPVVRKILSMHKSNSTIDSA